MLEKEVDNMPTLQFLFLCNFQNFQDRSHYHLTKPALKPYTYNESSNPMACHM